MFPHLCSLLIISLYWQQVASRHIVQQPFYPTYPDYSYMYSGLAPFHQQHSPFFSPPGTYFDQRQGILRPFPGGGVPVIVNYHKRCSNNFVGLRAHPDQQQYYYVCKPDCVIFGKCQNLQIFNATSTQCVQHPPPEYMPTCTGVGRFPLFSDCHLYFKCEEDLKPQIYSCPVSMIFSPASKKCIRGNKCTYTQISPQSSYIPEICANKFPPCFENGTFRSPSDCSLYYKCDLGENEVFMQTRSKCSQGNFYDLQKNECLPAREVPCDCIQVAELVFPKPNNLPYEPAVYPEHFNLDSIVDGQYPEEETNDSVTDANNERNEIVAEAAQTTTMTPFALDDELMKKNDTDYESDVFSDHIQKAQIKEDVRFTTDSDEFFNSSDDGSGLEPDFNALPVDEASNVINNDVTTVATATTTEEITKPGTTTTNTDKETTAEPTTLIAKEDVLGQNLEESGTTTISWEIEPTERERATNTRETPQSLDPAACENVIESGETNDKDTQTKNPSQTQSNKCLIKHTPTTLNTATESMKITTMPDIQNEQNSTTLTTTPHVPTTKLTTTNENLVATQIGNEIAERDDLKENILGSALNLEIDETTQSATENNAIEDPMTTSQNTIPTTHTRSINTNSLEMDISYEDLLDSEITKKTKAEFLEPKLTTIFDLQPKQDHNEMESETIASSKATTIKPVSTTTNKGIQGTNEQSTDVPINDEDVESALLDSAIKIDDFESVTQPQENFNANLLINEEFLPLAESPTTPLRKSRQENISANKKFVTLRQVEFSDEDFIPVKSENPILNEIEQENSIFEKDFDDDYTTVLAEKEITTTTLASTILNEILPAKTENNKIPLFGKVTTIKRRQTSLDEAVQTTTQINLAREKLANIGEQPKALNTNEENSLDDEGKPDDFDVLDSEIVKPGQGNAEEEEEEEEEVSNNEITSAETIQTTSNSSQQNNPLSHPPLTTTFTPTTHIPITKTTTNSAITTHQPSEKQTKSFILHIRKEDPEPQPPTLDSSPSRKGLYYTSKTKPVINNNNNTNNNETKTNNQLVTATHDMEFDSGKVPRLEIIAERPIDIHFSICPSICDKYHYPNESVTGKRAVLLKWFAGKSKQTLGFETANEPNMDRV